MGLFVSLRCVFVCRYLYFLLLHESKILRGASLVILKNAKAALKRAKNVVAIVCDAREQNDDHSISHAHAESTQIYLLIAQFWEKSSYGLLTKSGRTVKQYRKGAFDFLVQTNSIFRVRYAR